MAHLEQYPWATIAFNLCNILSNRVIISPAGTVDIVGRF